ncbi:MAG: hypothetical protein EBR09_16800 [Proteobacteria bacterium]|nr:hypothetical protein [Pseudomonadota bacterium]
MITLYMRHDICMVNGLWTRHIMPWTILVLMISPTSCIICPAGTFSENVTSNTCIKCEAGKFSTTTGATAVSTCVNCSANTYSEIIGASSINTCKNCPINSISSTGSRTISNCTCNAGFTGPTDGNCSACALGKYKSIAGSGSCNDCEPNSNTTSLNSKFKGNCICNVDYSGYDGEICTRCDVGKNKNVRNSSEINLARTCTGPSTCALCCPTTIIDTLNPYFSYYVNDGLPNTGCHSSSSKDAWLYFDLQKKVSVKKFVVLKDLVTSKYV